MDSLVALSQLGYSRPLVAEALKQACTYPYPSTHIAYQALQNNVGLLSALSQLGSSCPLEAEALNCLEPSHLYLMASLVCALIFQHRQCMYMVPCWAP